jgi:predicted anti-sigma-YlaC factor YlaD
MTELTCDQARELAPEYGLGILTQQERVAVTAHMLSCTECRNEVDEYTRLGEDLMDVIPAAEPPPGFDRRVLESLPPRRRRPRRGMIAGAGAALAAAAAAAVILVVTPGSHGHTDIRANLVADGHTVGSVYTEGKPPYLWMAVKHVADSGTVSCQIVKTDGTVVTLGSFDLVDGSGWWATPEPADLGHVATARLVTANGHVVAQATFNS